MAVTKSELMQRLLAAHPTLSMADIERAVNIVFEEITHTLMDGGRVELRGFGAFSIRERAPRKGRNPRTGDDVTVPAKRVPFFKAGKELKQRVDS